MKWEYLMIGEQAKYRSKAMFLIDKGYVPAQDEEKLAKKIYETEQKSENGDE